MAWIAAESGDWHAVERWAGEALRPNEDALAEAAAAEGRYLAVWSQARRQASAGQWERARALMGQAIELVEKEWHGEHLYLAPPLLDLARLEQARNRIREAERLARRAEAIYHQSTVPEHPGRIAVNRLLESLDESAVQAR